MDITYFNPNSQKEADFVRGFVARQKTFDFFIKQLQLIPQQGNARHYLIVAPRGFGKTSLLRRIAIGVALDDELRSRFIALRFREEQHNVISLDVFWRNCLQSLAEAREDECAPTEEIEELDRDWEMHAPRRNLNQEEQDGEPVWETFRSHCERLQRRPLLLIDNLDTLLIGLSEQHQWSLRRYLQRDDGPVLLAAASRYPSAIHDPGAPFYEFFRLHTLDKLDDNEVFACLRNLAVRRGAPGEHVLHLLEKDPGRVAALNTLAGGNPRTLSVLYGVLESHTNADLLSQLSAMLDTFTGWYQARTEELPPQQRAVFDALALNWDPMTAANLGQATGLDTATVSSQLTRLEKSGYAEAVSLSKRGKGRRGYQVSERFYNIWYLMRNGPRRTKQSIRFLTSFLQTCFSHSERRSLAERALKNSVSDPGYSLALASCIKSGGLRRQLLDHAYVRSSEIGMSSEYGPLIDDLRNAPSITPSNDTSQLATPQERISRLDKAITKNRTSLQLDKIRILIQALINKATILFNIGDDDLAMAAVDEVLGRFFDSDDVFLREGVLRAFAIKASIFTRGGEFEQALKACDEAIKIFKSVDEQPQLFQAIAQVLHTKAYVYEQTGEQRNEIAVYNELISRFGDIDDTRVQRLVIRALFNNAVTLGVLGEVQEELGYYEKIIEKYQDFEDLEIKKWFSRSLFNKAYTLGSIGKVEEEISTYEALEEKYGAAAEFELREIVARGLLFKGMTLGNLGRFPEEIDSYDQIILNNDQAHELKLRELVIKAYIGKAHRYYSLERFDEELTVFDRLLERLKLESDPALEKYKPMALTGKAMTISILGDKEEERHIYDSIFSQYRLSLDSELREEAAKALFNKSVSFGEQEDYDSEISTCNELIDYFSLSDNEGEKIYVAQALLNKGLRLGRLGKFEAAISALGGIADIDINASNESFARVAVMALFGKSLILGQMDRTVEELETLEYVIANFENVDVAQDYIAKAMLSQSDIFARLGKTEKALSSYSEIIQKFSKSGRAELIESVVGALSGIADVYRSLGQVEKELAALNEVTSRYGSDSSPSIQIYVARAIFDSSSAYEKLGRPEQKIRSLDEVIKRYSSESVVGLVEIVRDAYQVKAVTLRDLGQVDESRLVLETALAWRPDFADFYVTLGNLFLDFIGDFEAALDVYKKGVLVADDPNLRAILNANIAYGFGLFTEERGLARQYATSALDGGDNISVAGKHLLLALPIWGDGLTDWNSIFQNIGLAVASDDPELWVTYADDVERLLAYALRQNHGGELRDWMIDNDYPRRYAPLFHAFAGVIEGEDHLLSINPETRQAALPIYTGIKRRANLTGTHSLKIIG